MDYSIFGTCIIAMTALTALVMLICWATGEAVQCDRRYRVRDNECFDAMPINYLPPFVVFMLFVGLVVLTIYIYLWEHWSATWITSLVCADIVVVGWTLAYWGIFVSSPGYDQRESQKRAQKYEKEVREKQAAEQALAKEAERAARATEQAASAKREAERIVEMTHEDNRRLVSAPSGKSLKEIDEFQRQARLMHTHYSTLLSVNFLGSPTGQACIEWRLNYDSACDLRVVGRRDGNEIFDECGAGRHYDQLVCGTEYKYRLEVFDGSNRRGGLTFSANLPNRDQWETTIDEFGKIHWPGGPKPELDNAAQIRKAFEQAARREQTLDQVEADLTREIEGTDLDSYQKGWKISRIKAMRQKFDS